jgi:hypothetical protein
MSPGVAARGSAHGFVTDGNGPYIYHVGVDDSSSTVNPDCRFDLVTADPAALVDPLWPGAIVGATAVDQSDNGLISFVSVDDSFFAANYDAGTTYAAGDPVRANPVVGGQFSFYVSLVNGNIGNTPASSPTDWGLIQKQYLVKFNTGPFSVSGVGTFGLAWKVPISIMANQGNLQGYSRISNKLFGYLVCDSGVSTAYVYRTGDGSLWVSAVIPGVTVFANPSFNLQCFDDVTQSFVFQGTYDSTVTGAPAPLNATVTTGGAWMRLILAFTPPPPPPAPPPGGGYIIERFDNRIWPTVENAWCVDCGFTLPRPTPASDLTMDSATGAGILTGVTDLVGGSGYSASTTAQVIDGNGLGPGTGAIPILTIVGGVITAIAFAPAGSGYVYPNLVFNDPENTGSGASAKVTLDNSCMCTASDPIFVLDDVGSVIRLGYGVAPITSFVDSTHVIVNMLSPTVFLQPDDPIPPNTQTQLAGTWTMTKPISSFYLPQLIGFEITGLADGQIIPPVVVPANGIVTLAQPASAIIVGLGFQAQLQSTYLDAGEPTVQGQRKKIAEVTVRVEQSASFQAGGNQPDGSVQSPQQLAPPWQNMIDVPNPAVPPFNSPAQQLFTGDIRVPIPSGYNTRGQVAVQQSNPLPLQVLDYVPEVLAGDKASQEVPKREQPQNGRKGR